MEKNGIGHPSNVSFRSPREGRYPLRGPSDRMLPQNQNHASGSGPPLALREAASARGQLSNPLRRHAHATSAPPRNVGGARLLLAPSDHQGAGGRNEAPPPPSAAAGASARSSSAASRHADGNLKNGDAATSSHAASLSPSLPEASRLAACSPGARLPTTPTSTIPIIIVLNDDAPEQPDETRDAVDHLCAAGGDSHYVPLAPAKIRDFPEDLLDHAVLS